MRIEGRCVGDCAKCQLLQDGEVDMIPCVLDQIFRRVQVQAVTIEQLSAKVKELSEREEKDIVLVNDKEEEE